MTRQSPSIERAVIAGNLLAIPILALFAFFFLGPQAGIWDPIMREFPVTWTLAAIGVLHAGELVLLVVGFALWLRSGWRPLLVLADTVLLIMLVLGPLQFELLLFAIAFVSGFSFSTGPVAMSVFALGVTLLCIGLAWLLENYREGRLPPRPPKVVYWGHS